MHRQIKLCTKEDQEHNYKFYLTKLLNMSMLSTIKIMLEQTLNHFM